MDEPMDEATVAFCRQRIVDIEAERLEHVERYTPTPTASIEDAIMLAATWILTARDLGVSRDDLDLVTSVYYGAYDAVRARDRRSL